MKNANYNSRPKKLRKLTGNNTVVAKKDEIIVISNIYW